MGKRIVFTGGSGKGGRNVIAELLKRGHNVLNLDIMPLANLNVHTIKCDITDSGQVFNALTCNWAITEPFPADLPSPPDVVVHFAGFATPLIAPDNETFRVNVLGMHNVIEAACKLGVKKIIIASSVTTYGITFAHGERDFPSFPVDEDVATDPTDTYALSKVCGERIAQSFAKRFGIDIYAFRIGRITEPQEYHSPMFRSYVEEPEKWAVHGWSYIDVRDLGQMCHLAIQKSGLGFQVFNATNDCITNYTPTEKFLKDLYPHLPFTREMGEFEAPMSNAKIKKMLGFKEEHHWQKYYGKTTS